MNRRTSLTLVAASVVAAQLGCTPAQEAARPAEPERVVDRPQDDRTETGHGESMKVHYLEIVSTDVEASCALYEQLHQVTFGESIPNLGGARTAKLASGGTIGVRAPMHGGEKPVTRRMPWSRISKRQLLRLPRPVVRSPCRQ